MMMISDTYGLRLIWAKRISTKPHATFLIKNQTTNYSRFGLEHDDPFTNLCQDILNFEKLSKVLIMGEFNARVRIYQNTNILEENVVDPFL